MVGGARRGVVSRLLGWVRWTSRSACPTFVGDDLEALRVAARQHLVLYTALSLFTRLFPDIGFAEEAALMERGDWMADLSDRLLDGICIIGPTERCQEQITDSWRPASTSRSCTRRSGSMEPGR
jgi:hypothetical protein